MSQPEASSSARKLAAVLFADLVDYTALMQANEQKAASTLKQFQASVKDSVKAFQGRIVNFYGDGVLAVFDTPLQAVQCAMQLQKGFRADATPVRVGLHSGTVVFDGDQVYGDSVNLASRIESMGTAGSVLFSERVRWDIKNHPEFQARSLGRFAFKNVERPMEVFALANEDFVVPSKASLRGKFQPSTFRAGKWIIGALVVIGVLLLLLFVLKRNKTAIEVANKNDQLEETGQSASTIAVLPFTVQGDQDLSYLSEGMVDLISTKLDGMGGLKGVDPNALLSRLERSQRSTRDPSVGQKIASHFQAERFILGNVLKVGEEVTLSASLYDDKGQFLSRTKSKAAGQNELPRAIDELVRQLVAQDHSDRQQAFAGIGALTTDNMDALRAYLEGEQLARRGKLELALEPLRKATELDSTFAFAWLRLRNVLGWLGAGRNPAEMQQAMEKAMRHRIGLGPRTKGIIEGWYAFTKGNGKESIRIFRQLNEQYRHDAMVLYGLGEALFHYNTQVGGSFVEARPIMRQFYQYDPHNWETLRHLHDIETFLGNVAAADSLISRVEEHSSNYFGTTTWQLFLQDSSQWNEERLRYIANHPQWNEERDFLFPGLTTQIPRLQRFVEKTNRYSQQPTKTSGLVTIKTMRAHESIPTPQLARNLCKVGFLLMDKLPLALQELVDTAKLFTNDTSPEERQLLLPFVQGAVALWNSDDVGSTKALQALLDLEGSDRVGAFALHLSLCLEAFQAHREGEDDQALALIDRAIEQPGIPWHVSYLGLPLDLNIVCEKAPARFFKAELLYTTGRLDEALMLYQHIKEPFYHYSTYYLGPSFFRRGQIYEQMDKPREALRNYQAAIDFYEGCTDLLKPLRQQAEEGRKRVSEGLN